MYIDKLIVQDTRTFDNSTIHFVHPDMDFRAQSRNGPDHGSLLPKPKLPNVNLLLGENASGKTTVLQAIALAALGPAAREAKLPHRRLVRYPSEREPAPKLRQPNPAFILATLRRHEPEMMGSDPSDPDPEEEQFESMQEFELRGELESMQWAGIDWGSWSLTYESTNTAFFCAAYGSNHRVESVDSPELGIRDKIQFARAQRVQSVFQDGYPLYRLANWLPRLRKASSSRYEEISMLLQSMTGPGHFHFTGILREREYEFERSGTSVPFPGLSDGYRGFIGWVGDLLYHLNHACPHAEKLVDISGIVMVDEIDLLPHPKWQMRVIKTIAKALPRMQFIFTSHSPLVASSLEWMNINLLTLNPKTNRTVVKQLKHSIHGLDADQVLLSDFFGLKSTVAPSKQRQLAKITERIRAGDKNAPLQLIREMESGTEAEE
jgi:AAA domain, putative AbiEii toxin, Type IV TA system/AAA domain